MSEHMSDEEQKEIENMWIRHINSPDCDPDLIFAKRNFFDVSRDEILVGFSRNVIERKSELRVMPDELFNRYFDYFIDFILYVKHDEFHAAEIADCFTTLLNEKVDEGVIQHKEIIDKSEFAIYFLKKRIKHYNTDIAIYGDLEKKIDLLEDKLKSYII